MIPAYYPKGEGLSIYPSDTIKETLPFGKEAALKLARALAEIYENLAQTVTREEFNELKEIVCEQGENLKILTQRVDQLTEDVRKLTGEMGNRWEASASVGYTLENEAYRYLPALLRRDYGVEVREPLIRTLLKNAKGQKPGGEHLR